MRTSLPLVWKHFHALCAVPRPSGHERDAVNYVRDVAESLKLEWKIDRAGNITVRKKASPGCEGRTGVVLQSHLDMVPQKNEGTEHDFLKDPIQTYIDDSGWMRAKGTTLGADNGIGAAVALAALEDVSLKHGPIEALFTVDEEAGMAGARGLKAGALKGRAFINLDTEDEGEIYIGCAGGVDVTASVPIEWEERAVNGGKTVGLMAGGPAKPPANIWDGPAGFIGFETDGPGDPPEAAPDAPDGPAGNGAGGSGGQAESGGDGGTELEGYVPVLLSVTGLRGGHSGLDINLGRGNAIKILAGCLYWLSAGQGVRVASIKGGSARNAIPREAFCELAVPEKDLDNFAYYIRMTENTARAELIKSDPGIKITVGESKNAITRLMTPASQKRLLDALYNCPSGVEAMSAETSGVVETSGNLAVINTGGGAAEIGCLIRSSIYSARDSLAAKTAAVFKRYEASVRVSGEYPGWKADYGSRLLQVMKSVYQKTFGAEPAVKVVHAGLECGIIADKYPRMEFVSVGPTIKHPHSPDECLDVKSVEKFWTYMTAVLNHDF